MLTWGGSSGGLAGTVEGRSCELLRASPGHLGDVLMVAGLAPGTSPGLASVWHQQAATSKCRPNIGPRPFHCKRLPGIRCCPLQTLPEGN